MTYGERATSCASFEPCTCPRCKKYTRSELLARNINLLKEGIRRAGSNAEFVSWTYQHRESPIEEIKEYVRLAPPDVALMENFEDAGFATQLGKTRQAIDYWLSYVGPSQMFEGAAKTARKEGRRMFAKMQVCCSHELATVPYIPVPGILFEKYSAAHEYRVQGVMQCWYFGNYPSLMSKAAGELSFMEDFSDKDKFLEYLAGIYYGSRAKEAVKAWKHFEEGYKNYPINIMFSYYGPMHDGVVWELALLPKDTSLPRSWLLMDKPDGDRIGECLQSGHLLEEAVELTGNMRREWRKGVGCLPDIGPKEQRSIAEALKLLLESGNNILRFYELRRRLAKESGDTEAILKEMEEIVDSEIHNSREMIPLCEADPRLGYHSEAEGFKFFPEKLNSRIEQLKKLKQEEFSQVRQNLAEGMPPLSWYRGEEGSSYRLIKGNVSEAVYVPISEQASFRASFDEEYLYIELKGTNNTSYMLFFEYELMWPAPGIIIKDNKIELTESSITHQSVFGEKKAQELAKYEFLDADASEGRYVLAVSRKLSDWTEDKPLRARIAANDVSWIADDEPVHSLGKEFASTGEFGWLLPPER